MQKTTNRIGLVTGASFSGCTILIGARNQALAEQAVGKLAAENLDVRYILVDLDDSIAIAAAARENRRGFRPPRHS